MNILLLKFLVKINQKKWQEFVDYLGYHIRYANIKIISSEKNTIKILVNKNKQNIEKLLSSIIAKSVLSEKDYIIHFDESTSISENCYTKKKLPYKLQKEITTYQEYTFLLSIINEYPELEGWRMQHFLNLVSGEVGYRFYDYCDYMVHFYHEVFDIHRLSYDLIEKVEITDEIVKGIQNGYYALIWLDHHHLKCFGFKNHFVHPVLIYGYDLERNTFQMACFHSKKGSFLAEERMSDVSISFEKGKLYYSISTGNVEYAKIELIKPKKIFGKFEFSLDQFIKDMDDYLSSTGDNNTLYFRYGYALTKDKCKMGISYYDAIINALKHMDSDNLLDYKAFHILSEHKHNIKRTLCYIVKKYDFEKLNNYISEYDAIISLCNQTKYLYLKDAITHSNSKNIYQISNNASIKLKLENLLLEAKNIEKNALRKILIVIKNCLIEKNTVYYRLNQLKFSRKHISNNRVNWIFNKPISIDSIHIPNEIEGEIYFNNGMILPINKKLSTYSFKSILVENFWIENKIEKMDIEIFSTNLVKYKKITASSIAKNPDGSIHYDNLPEKAIDSNPNTFWSADFKDTNIQFLEIDFGVLVDVNHIIIAQCEDYLRICSFSIYYQENEKWEKVYTFNNREMGRHPINCIFNEITTNKMKITFDKVKADSSGYSCPTISLLEAYCD